MKKIKKKTIINDTFETLSDLGKSTAKTTVKSISEAFIPDAFTSTAAVEEQSGKTAVGEIGEFKEQKRGNNHTSIDTEKLYKDHDKQNIDAVRQRLFNIVKSDEERIIEENKRKLAKQEHAEESEHHQKKQEGIANQQQGGGLPSGKKRRSIFSPKKKAQEQHPETRPSTGKQ
ncbi:MAG: hypothetical protein AAB966_05875 [Patescibacteria group bacterium]